MASNGRDAAHEKMGSVDSKLVSSAGQAAVDSNPDVDPKLVSKPQFDGHACGMPKVDGKLVSE